MKKLLVLVTLLSVAPVFAMNIFRAVIHRDRARVAQLLDEGTPIDAQDDYECTPLILAVDHGDTDMARLLLDRGASLTQRGPCGMNPIDVANANENQEMRQLLIDTSVARREASRQNAQPQQSVRMLQLLRNREITGNFRSNPY